MSSKLVNASIVLLHLFMFSDLFEVWCNFRVKVWRKWFVYSEFMCVKVLKKFHFNVTYILTSIDIFLAKFLIRNSWYIDPNDNDNRCSAPCKLNSSSQPSTVQPNEEDVSFLLGSMQVLFTTIYQYIRNGTQNISSSAKTS